VSSPTGLQGRILAEFARLAPTARGGLVSIPAIRQSLGVPQAEFDAAVLALDRSDQLRLAAIGDRSRLTAQELRDSIQGENETFAFVEPGPAYQAPAATPPPPPPPPPAPPPAPPPSAPAPAPGPAGAGAAGIAEATGIVPHYDEPVGVRVRMEVVLVDAAGRDIPGSDMTRDITVNVAPGTPVQDVLQAAIAYAQAGNLGRRNNENYRVRVLSAWVSRIVEGGFDDPSLPGLT
jgi:hypothetical protein